MVITDALRPSTRNLPSKILQGEKPITSDKADLPNRLPKAREEIEHLHPSDESVINYAMFPRLQSLSGTPSSNLRIRIEQTPARLAKQAFSKT